jgi:REP element-mobilizing transposase RayT
MAAERDRMRQNPYTLDAVRRPIVLKAIQEVCAYRGWMLMAAHVRTEHVHVVVAADKAPEAGLSTFKAYSSRALNNLGIDPSDRNRWVRHGSTRYLWGRNEITAAIHYVVSEQGTPMDVYHADRSLTLSVQCPC